MSVCSSNPSTEVSGQRQCSVSEKDSICGWRTLEHGGCSKSSWRTVCVITRPTCCPDMSTWKTIHRERESVLTLTTTLTCFDKSLELRWRKSENAACKHASMFTHTHTHTNREKKPIKQNYSSLHFLFKERCFLSNSHPSSLTRLSSAASKKLDLTFLWFEVWVQNYGAK